MSYLHKYKAGDITFRTLSEIRMRLRILRNTFRYGYPAPTSIAPAHKILAAGNLDYTYDIREIPTEHRIPSTRIIPEASRAILEKDRNIDFPESFVLTIKGGSVVGDGTVLVGCDTILSESTVDFHRKQEHHHLLSEYRIPKPEPFDGRLAVISTPGSDNYFHWTLDAIPRLSLLRGTKHEIDAYYINSTSHFHREWLDMLGIPGNQIIAARANRHIAPRELVIPSFAGMPGLPSKNGLGFLRSFMPAEPSTKRALIYISRSTARRRRLLNEDIVYNRLAELGFETVQLANMSVAEQMRVFESADVIVAPHGAELTNLCFCRPGTTLIELFSPLYLNPCFKHLSSMLDITHSSVVGKGRRSHFVNSFDAHHVWANIAVDISKLDEALSHVL